MHEAGTSKTHGDSQTMNDGAGSNPYTEKAELGLLGRQINQVDSMLEMLPDGLDGEFLDMWNSKMMHKQPQLGGIHGENGGIENNESENIGVGLTQDYGDLVEEEQETRGSVEPQGLGAAGMGIQTRPIDIVQPVGGNHYSNLQNGEIDQLWDFNVDEFMMTPSEQSSLSDGATISQPNSFTSDAAVGDQVHQHQYQMNSTWDQLLLGTHGGGMQFDNDLQFLSQPIFGTNGSDTGQILQREGEHPSSSNGNPATDGGVGEMSTAFSRVGGSSKRSSAHIKSTNQTEDGHIPLSSQTVTNSVRKNQVTRQLSSSSLTSYRKGASANNISGTKVPAKPQVQCFNCKTYKTPLWRRDPQGNTLCNACGLFQKLHGTMRPLSLKSDVIKKRNTKKRSLKKATQVPSQDQTSKSLSNSSQQSTTTPKQSKGLVNEEGNSNAIWTDTQQKIQPVETLTTVLPQRPSTAPTKSAGYHDSNVSITGVIKQQQQFHRKSSQDAIAISPTANYSNKLNSNNLMNHNKRMSSGGFSGSRKSRRSSTSSSASNSSRSSSRQVVHILPKPSPDGSGSHLPLSNSNSTLNFQPTSNYSSISAVNSSSSSPRYVSSPRICSNSNANSNSSPMPSSSILSTSGGRGSSIATIPRRKSSRALVSQSLSFMAQSLQQLQNQNNTTVSNTMASSSTLTWNSACPSPNATNPNRSPRLPSDLFSNSQQSHEFQRSISLKSHTSLLSQQLQKNSNKLKPQPSALNGQAGWSNPFPTSHSVGITAAVGTTVPSATSSSLKRSNVAASPRNSYAVSLQQQRGFLSYDQQLQRSTLVSQMNDETANSGPKSATTKEQENMMDDLDWLRFGI
ncbi:nitrogen-responsive transcriptional regulator GLN3 Ecym_2569 [Eremothecium cymbalariae DBVPG|uniref:GATA-type domain-containing protein n=1 Tax=Eremothecium cymbalariae (strain CBS 270.75 / DBVPG 7215 / KCTC 17166 / NRRL Y-17582) TaxID=931890 RepID=G8JQC8_ERECY|nr:Hypothetical protein Ecym_2569 [Eremothecium cymbalariae DBVPG\